MGTKPLTRAPPRTLRPVFDEQLGQFVSDAEVAGAPFTAFTSKPKAQRVTARLIVRRVRDTNPDHVTVNAQGELFRVWRHHAIFTDSPLPMLDAEADHRRHSIIEQVVADLKDGQLAHLPSGDFAAKRLLGSPRRRSTSPAPPGRSPLPSTPRRPPRPSAANSSFLPPG